MLEEPNSLNPFALWDVARKTLDDAIQHYLDSSITLTAAVSQSSSLFPDQSSFEAAVNTIGHDLNSIKSRHERLESAQSSLRRIRNKSSVLIPFHKLPLEIMTRNFDVAAGRSCACDSISETLQPAQDYGPETLLAITHVCTYWRGVAVSHSSLWSHVTFDIERDSDFADGPNCPQNWLRRARSAPLYVHLDGEPPNRRMGNRKADSVVNQLRPHLNKIIGVRFTTGWTYSMTRQFLLKILAQGGADSVREFIHLGGSSPWGDQELLLASSSHPSHNLESPMPSLRVLDLKETCFAWDSTIYKNLVDLRLDFLDGASFPTIPQLLGVLSACPDLRLLSLRGVIIAGQSGPHFTSVTLKALEVLDISFMDPNAIPLLLPLISSGKSELSVRVDCLPPNAGHAIEAIISFFRHSRVIRLFLVDLNHPCISKYLASLHDLQVLTFDLNSKQEDGSLEAITYLASPDDDRLLARCPKLQSLYLLKGALTNSTIQDVVKVHTLKKLTFGACFLDPFEEELMHWLKPVVPDVTCVKELKWDLSTNWYLCMM